jgi:hypothetical protein
MANLIVDSSVWIDFFNKKTSDKIEFLKVLLLKTPWAPPIIILPVIMQEILQGIENNKYYSIVKENLQGFEYLHYDSYQFSIKAAELYRNLRQKGVTIRKANDCLIAAISIEHKIPLLHNDKDFDNIAKYTTLKIYKPEQ